MGTGSNAALLRQVIEEVFNKAAWDELDRFYSPDYIQHNPAVPPGIDGMKGYFQTLYQAFPDWQGRIDHLLADGDLVCAFITWTGTQQGEFQGLPPTGRRVQLSTADLFRVADGRLAEHWDVVDLLGMLRQLGLGVAPEPAGTASSASNS